MVPRPVPLEDPEGGEDDEAEEAVEVEGGGPPEGTAQPAFCPKVGWQRDWEKIDCTGNGHGEYGCYLVRRRQERKVQAVFLNSVCNWDFERRER